MTPWWQGRLVAFDLETTGIDVEEARIVTATVAAVGGGLAAEIVTLIADPGIPIPDGAAKIHGYTTERAQAEGKPARDVVTATLALLTAFRAETPIVAYNARYDFTVLDREARRHGLGLYQPFPIIDPLVIDKECDKFRKGSRRLEAVCQHYGCRLDGAHDSAHDALAAARIVYRMGQRGLLDDMTAEGLHDAQIGWAASQARSLADYFRSKGRGEDAAGVREDWPVIPSA